MCLRHILRSHWGGGMASLASLTIVVVLDASLGVPRVDCNWYGSGDGSTCPSVSGPAHNDADNGSSQERTASSYRASNDAHVGRASRLTGLPIARLRNDGLGVRAYTIAHKTATR
eukprot:scaffold598_cov235-Prasinococcus_capsulatus_cf.AAC.1